MIEKIEITQRFNFKRLNRHYECFTIDFLNNSAYYKISERGSGDKFLTENSLCDDSWIDILVDLRRKMTSEIHRFTSSDAVRFMGDFMNLDLFDDFQSEDFSYFEKIELIYSCQVIIYSSDNYEEYSFKNNFPAKWIEFGEILRDFFGFDVLHLDHQKRMATPLFYDVRPDGVYFDGEKLNVRTIEFGHYRTYPYDIPKPRLIVDFAKSRVDGYVERDLSQGDGDVVRNLLVKFHVCAWIFDAYHRKSDSGGPNPLDGHDWYLEMVFDENVIWHIFGYNDYPDTYVHLGREVMELTGMDLCEIGSIAEEDLELFNKFGNEILSEK